MFLFLKLFKQWTTCWSLLISAKRKKLMKFWVYAIVQSLNMCKKQNKKQGPFSIPYADWNLLQTVLILILSILEFTMLDTITKCKLHHFLKVAKHSTKEVAWYCRSGNSCRICYALFMLHLYWSRFSNTRVCRLGVTRQVFIV